MSSYFSRLNSSERRFLVLVGMLFFVAINVFWIWPRFSDWGDLQDRIFKARGELARREAAIAQVPAIQRNMAKLGGDTDVPPEDQAAQMQTAVISQAGRSGVGLTSSGRTVTQTNDPFFVQQVLTGVSFISREEQLVDFLYNLGSSASMIRVRGLSLRPDPSQQQLAGGVTLVASYRKTTPARSPAASRPRATPAPAATPRVPERTVPAPPGNTKSSQPGTPNR